MWMLALEPLSSKIVKALKELLCDQRHGSGVDRSTHVDSSKVEVTSYIHTTQVFPVIALILHAVNSRLHLMYF